MDQWNVAKMLRGWTWVAVLCASQAFAGGPKPGATRSIQDVESVQAPPDVVVGFPSMASYEEIVALPSAKRLLYVRRLREMMIQVEDVTRRSRRFVAGHGSGQRLLAIKLELESLERLLLAE